jgi:hypothetical protein
MISEQLSLFETKYDVIDQKVDESFWIYHAGMADGDGCFYYNYQPKYSLGLIDKNIIKEIADLYGTKIHKRKKLKKHHKAFYTTALTGKNARHFISKLAPYLVEKKKVVRNICKEHRIEIKDVGKINFDRRLAWLCGYFDAEGHVCMRPTYNKKSNNYNFRFIVRFTSSNKFVLRVVRRIMNFIFNRNTGKKSIINLYEKKEHRPNHRQCYDLEMKDMLKIHLFAKVFVHSLKVKRKIKTLERIAKYAHFCAWQKWTFGKTDFKKNLKLRDKWLKANEN